MRTGATLLLALMSFVQADPHAAENPFVGTWTADLSKSRLDPRAQFQSATLRITVSDDTVTLAQELVYASGEKQGGAETFRTDGTESPGTLAAGVSHVARWIGSHVLAAIAKKGGNVVAVVTYQVSSDGKSLTARSSGTLEQVIVFDRNQLVCGEASGCGLSGLTSSSPAK